VLKQILWLFFWPISVLFCSADDMGATHTRIPKGLFLAIVLSVCAMIAGIMLYGDLFWRWIDA